MHKFLSVISNITISMFSVKYAIKSINRRKKKNFATVLAVALGVTLLTGVNAGSKGMTEALASSWWSYIGDVDIEVIDPINEYFSSNVSVEITSSNHYALSELVVAAPMIRYYSMPIYSDGNFRKDVQINGINPLDKGFAEFYDLDGSIIDIQSVLTKQSAIISKEMATLMDINKGDKLSTVLPDGNGTSIPAEFIVKAIFDDGIGRGREGWFRIRPQMYVNLSDLQDTLIPELKSHITRIQMIFLSKENGGQINKNLEDLDIDGKNFEGKKQLEEAVKAVERIANELLPVAFVWSERVIAANEINSQIANIKSVLNIFVFLLNATALLLIINVQSMSLEDRRNQTAILRAMGASRLSILRIFLLESSLIGIIGSIVGLVMGYFYGEFIQFQMLKIFELETGSSSLDQPSIIQGIIFGVAISVLTAVIPAYRSSGMNITAELRGIPQPETQKKGNKTIIFGILFTIIGLMFAQNVGDFWKKQAWSNFDNQIDIMLGLGLTIAGIGMLLTLVIPRRLALNISGFSIWGFALFSMFVAVEWVEEGDGSNWFTIILLYLVIGSSILTIVNFEQIMNWLNSLLFYFTSVRAIAQITTTQMIGKKSRATLVFTIFTIILVLNVFLSSAAYTMRTNFVDQYEWRSYGIDVVVDTEVPSNDVVGVISDIDGVEQVFAMRTTWVSLYWISPESEEFDAIKHTFWRKIVEVPEEIINPNGNWDESSFPISFDGVSENDAPKLKDGMSPEEHKEYSINLFEDFYSGKTRELTWDDGSKTYEVMTIGGYFSNLGGSFFFQGKNEVIPAFRIGSSVNFMGPWDAFGGNILVTPEIAAELTEFENIKESNLFLVRSSNSYFDSEANLDLAQEIERRLNKLDDPSSLSFQKGFLIGGTTRLIEAEMRAFWEREADVWDFLSTFAAIGLIIGASGMIVIAARSVSERQREIGMMRAIGFSRTSVVSSVILEMTTLAIMGLISGIVNGVLIMQMFSVKIMDIAPNYPINILALYTLLVIGVAFIAAVVPGIRASRIAPSQALRYTG